MQGFSITLSSVDQGSYEGFEKAPRPIPLLEREERQNAQKQRLRGLDIDGQHEPSFALVDKAANSFTKNQLARIEWKEQSGKALFQAEALSN